MGKRKSYRNGKVEVCIDNLSSMSYISLMQTCYKSCAKNGYHRPIRITKVMFDRDNNQALVYYEAE